MTKLYTCASCGKDSPHRLCKECANPYQQIIDTIATMDSDDGNMPALEKAMQFYCSTHDKCEGYKHALITCLEDQYGNHPEDQTDEDAEKLLNILDPIN